MAADVKADIDSEHVHTRTDSVSDMRARADDAADMTACTHIAIGGMATSADRTGIAARTYAVRTGLRARAHGPDLGAAAHVVIILGKGSPGCENSHGED